MSSIAPTVDVVDVHWRIFQWERKPLTPRGRSRIIGHRRTRGHDVLEKHDGSPKHSGRRFVALASATVCDIASGIAEFFEPDEEDEPQRLVVGYIQPAYQYEEARRHVDMQELDQQQLQELLALEADLQREALRELKVLSSSAGFEDRVEMLEHDPEIGTHDIAVTLEKIELAAYALCAA